MTINYYEFDTTAGNIIADLVAKLLLHPSWSDITPSSLPSTTLTASHGTGSTTLTCASTTGIAAGDTICLSEGLAAENWVQVLAVTSGTTFTMVGGTALTQTQANAATVKVKAKILKCTTTRGADMIINFYGGGFKPQNNMLCYDVLRSHTGSNGGRGAGRSRYLIWRQSNSSTSSAMQVHVAMSVGKEHLYVEVEGPRGPEAQTTHTIYGSTRTYMALSDVVPYHASDTTPIIAHIGCSNNTSTGSTQNYSHGIDLLEDKDHNPWDDARVSSMDFPTVRTSDTISLQRKCAFDGKEYVFPYVVFSVRDGIRGRLARFFNAGTTGPNGPLDLPDNPGDRVTYDGVIYKYRAVNKGDGTVSPWNAFGSSSSATGVYSPVVAIPIAEV